MNKVCFILPVYGKTPNSYIQFINSIIQNSSFIDLLIITDDENNFINQSNIKTLYFSTKELGERVQNAVKKIFNIFLETPFAVQMSNNRFGLYKLTDYKFFYGEMFKEELKEYSYWGFLDWDIIMGDISSVLPNFYDYDMIGTRGHFCCFKNNFKTYEIFQNEKNWEWLNRNVQQNKHIVEKFLNDSSRSWLFDEHFVQPTILKYSENISNNFKVFDTIKEGVICDVIHPHTSNGINYKTNFYLYKNNNFANQYFSYENGKIFRISEEESIKTEHLYVHLMGRNSLIENKINSKDVDKNLNFIIKPNYFLENDNSNCVIMRGGHHNLGNWFYMFMSAYTLSQNIGVPLFIDSFKINFKKDFLFLENLNLEVKHTKYDNNKIVNVPTHEKDYEKYYELLKNHKNISLHANYSMNMHLYKKYKHKFRELVSNKREVPYYDEKYLVIHIRAAKDILNNSPHGDYNLIPLNFYKKLIKNTKQIPVFNGLLEDNIITDTLKEHFPESIILESSKDPYYDFELLRRAKNKCISVSSFAYLAAYLGDEDSKIHMPIIGLFNPLQRPDLNFILKDDQRFKYYYEFEAEKWFNKKEQIQEIINISNI